MTVATRKVASEQSFTTSFLVDQWPEEVFEAVTNVRAWWTGEVKGKSAKVGDEFTFRYENLHFSRQRVVESVHGKRVVWLVTEANLSFADHPSEWVGTRVVFDIAKKGIMFFSAIDQQALAAKAGIELPPSTLLSFGNPALGSQFITAKGEAGLDWPVRLLVQQDDRGNVWAIYTDFGYIAKRHGITNRDAQFTMASGVVQSITSTVTAN